MAVSRQKARELRAQGMTFGQIGKELGVSRQRAQQLCDWPDPKFHRLTSEELTRLLALGRAGVRQCDIASEFGITESAVSLLLIKHGLRRRARRVK